VRELAETTPLDLGSRSARGYAHRINWKQRGGGGSWPTGWRCAPFVHRRRPADPTDLGVRRIRRVSIARFALMHCYPQVRKAHHYRRRVGANSPSTLFIVGC
jgi:hypothetical protein